MAIVRNTKSLEKINEIFAATDNAISVVDLIYRLKDQMNKTTVYRILDRLESEGKLHSFSDKDGLKLYAKCNNCSDSDHNDVHPHFQCSGCGKTECLPLDIKIPKMDNYQIESASMLLLGKCEECI
jgi:Fur family ferric uptake transcriptional regulator